MRLQEANLGLAAIAEVMNAVLVLLTPRSGHLPDGRNGRLFRRHGSGRRAGELRRDDPRGRGWE